MTHLWGQVLLLLRVLNLIVKIVFPFLIAFSIAVGSELSQAQVEYSKERYNNFVKENNIV